MTYLVCRKEYSSKATRCFMNNGMQLWATRNFRVSRKFLRFVLYHTILYQISANQRYLTYAQLRSYCDSNENPVIINCFRYYNSTATKFICFGNLCLLCRYTYYVVFMHRTRYRYETREYRDAFFFLLTNYPDTNSLNYILSLHCVWISNLSNLIDKTSHTTLLV